MRITVLPTLSLQSSSRIRALLFTAATIVPLAIASASDPPRHVTDLQTGGLLGAMTLASSVVTIAAGQRFTALTQDSRNELCQIVLNYYKSSSAGIASVRIVNAGGQILATCGA